MNNQLASLKTTDQLGFFKRLGNKLFKARGQTSTPVPVSVAWEFVRIWGKNMQDIWKSEKFVKKEVVKQITS